MTDTQSSEDPAQSFANGNAGIPDGWDAKFAECTKLAYIWIALCNWDHFGQVLRSTVFSKFFNRLELTLILNRMLFKRIPLDILTLCH